MHPQKNMYLHSAVTELGASLGYCLANINKYQNTSEFLADFGYIAAINGSITYLI